MSKPPAAPWRRSYALYLSFLDAVFSAVVVAPCVVGYWRSVWTLLTLHLTPEHPQLSATISTLIGIGGHLFFTLGQNIFSKFLHPDRHRLTFYVVSRFYTVVYAFVCVNGWRGPWELLLLNSTKDTITTVITAAVSVVALFAIRALRNIAATPFVVVTDGPERYFEVLTMFRLPVKEGKFLYFLDCLFSVLIVGTLVVFVWRGAWVLADLHLFPDDFVTSSWASLIIGYGSVVIAFALQPAMKYLCDRLTGLPRLLAADLFILFSLFSTVNVWRGIWNLLDLYFLPDNLELSCWITHSVCLVLLFLLGCSNSLLVRGVYIDAEEPAGKCVVFPCYYLRVLFQQERQLKISVAMQTADLKEVMEAQNNHVVISTVLDNHTKF